MNQYHQGPIRRTKPVQQKNFTIRKELVTEVLEGLKTSANEAMLKVTTTRSYYYPWGLRDRKGLVLSAQEPGLPCES